VEQVPVQRQSLLIVPDLITMFRLMCVRVSVDKCGRFQEPKLKPRSLAEPRATVALHRDGTS